MHYTEIKDYPTICAAIGEDVNVLPGIFGLSEREAKHTIKHFKFNRMVRAMNLNEDGTIWEPNWSTRQEKIQPWFEIKADKERPGGFAFSDSCCDFWDSIADVGSRHCFQDYERYRHALKHFEDMFLDEYLIR